MNEKRSWEEFRASGLLWWVNRTLHLFGWVIVVDFDSEGRAIVCYPARTKYRGFTTEIETECFTRLTEYIAKESGNLLDDTKSEG